MKRRDFFTAAVGTAAASTLINNELSALDTAAVREFIEIRTLWTADEGVKDRLIDCLEDLLLPNKNLFGVKNIGIFTINQDLHADDKNYDLKYNSAVFVISAAKSIQTYLTLHDKLQDQIPLEKRFQRFKKDALYIDMDNSLLYAFPNCPTLEIPNRSKDRVVQYRCYFSPSIDRNRSKRNMFDVRGETALFRRCGMAPVFFGETFYGNMMPNISYMLSFENDEKRRDGWKKFVTSDEWKKMSHEEEFKDTAIRIRNLFLKPSPNSEI